MRTIRLGPVAAWIAFCMAVVIAAPVRAADVEYPPTARVGLVPPAGFVVGKEFLGFEDRARKCAFLIVELPASAYEEVEKSATPEIFQQNGTTLESKEAFALKSGPAFLAIGRQEVEGVSVRKWILVASTPELTAFVTVQVPETEKDAYPDAVVRAALATLTFRTSVPIEEQLAVLPFTVADLAGFRILRVVPGSAALLTEGPKDVVELSEQPLILIVAAPGSANEPADRDRLARNIFAGTPGIKDIRLTRAEPQRIGGRPGHEILAEAKDTKSAAELTVVQWMRFGTSGHLRMIAMTRKDAWAATYPRFRTMRDGLNSR